VAISRDDSGATDRWSGSSYARHSHHHRAADDWFLSKHHPAATDVVVDLGCGSGEFTAKLATLVPDGRVIGIDQSRSMVDAAQRWPAPNLQFLQAPVQTLDDLLEWQSVDLVVSRAMLHWVPFSDYPQLFAAVFHVLRPGCWFHSESAAPGNVPHLIPMLDDLATEYRLPLPPRFPDPGLVFEMLEAAGFEIPPESVRTVAQRRPFTREETLGLLATQATVVLTRHLSDPGRAEELVRRAHSLADRLRRHDGSYDQTFVRLELLVRHPT